VLVLPLPGCRATVEANQDSGKALTAAAATDAANAMSAGVDAATASTAAGSSGRRRLMQAAEDEGMTAPEAYAALVASAHDLLTTQSASVVTNAAVDVSGSKAFCVGPALQVRSRGLLLPLPLSCMQGPCCRPAGSRLRAGSAP